ncbi:hypothetical protein KR044_012229, partial [Drosophila immigrans]
LVMMCLKISLLLMGLSMTMAYKIHHSLKADTKIQQLHSESMVLAETHQDLSSPCFAHYNPQLSQIVDRYEVEYDVCITAYKVSSLRIEDCYKDTRLQLESSAYSSCQSLSKCKDSSTACNEFACAAAMGAEQSKAMYNLSGDANELVVNIKEHYRRIDSTKTICVNNAERAYVENTADTYEQLNSCLAGNVQQNPTTSEGYTSISTRSHTTEFTPRYTYATTPR